ncbi:MAG: DUF58 domain-containing protein [Candidatus Sumerlaeaceae bacterium]
MAQQDLSFRFMTRRNAVLFLASFLLVIGFGTGTRAIIFFAELLVLTMLGECFLGARALDLVRVGRSHYPRSFEGSQIEVRLNVTNEGSTPVYMLVVTDSFPPGSNYHVRQMATHLPARSEIAFRYREVCSRRRGLYVLGPIRLQASDPLGLFTFERTENELSKLLVYPTAEQLVGFNVLGAGTHANVGSEIVRHIGRSEEFERLRAYHRGDPPRLIHWRSSARLGALHVKEFERNVVTQVTIYCDLHLVALSGLGDLTSVEYRIKVAGSIAQEAIHRHHFVRVVALKQPREETRLAGGSQHLTAILDWLALLKPAGSGSVEEQLIAESGMQRRGSTVILVLSSIHLNAARLLDAVTLLHMRRVKVLAVLVDDRSFIKLRKEQEEYYQKAPPLKTVAAALTRAGVVTYTIRNQESVTRRLGVPV